MSEWPEAAGRAASVRVGSWPFTDAQVSRLNDHCAHIANIQHANPTVSNAVLTDTRHVPPERAFIADRRQPFRLE